MIPQGAKILIIYNGNNNKKNTQSRRLRPEEHC